MGAKSFVERGYLRDVGYSWKTMSAVLRPEGDKTKVKQASGLPTKLRLDPNFFWVLGGQRSKMCPTGKGQTHFL